MISVDNGKYYHWQVEIQDLIVQGRSVFSDTYTVAIVDSGTSLTVVPYKEMLSIANSLGDKFGNDLFSCDN